MRNVVLVTIVVAMAAMMLLAGCPAKPKLDTPVEGQPPIPVTAPTAPGADAAPAADAAAPATDNAAPAADEAAPAADAAPAVDEAAPADAAPKGN